VDAAKAAILGSESLPAALDTIAEIATALQTNGADFGVMVTQRINEANVRLNSMLAGTRALPSLSVTGALTTGDTLAVTMVSTGTSLSLGGGILTRGALSVAGNAVVTGKLRLGAIADVEAALSVAGSGGGGGGGAFTGGAVPGSISVGGALNVVGTTALANATTETLNCSRAINMGPVLDTLAVGGISPSHWYRFDGDLTDSVGGKTMTMTVGSVAYTPVKNAYPYAALTTAFTAYFQPGVTFSTSTAPMTISFYARLTDVTVSGTQLAFDEPGAGVVAQMVSVMQLTGSNPRVRYGTPASNNWFETPPVNVWTHVTIVIPAGAAGTQRPIVYYDGVLQTVRDFGANMSGTVNLTPSSRVYLYGSRTWGIADLRFFFGTAVVASTLTAFQTTVNANAMGVASATIGTLNISGAITQMYPGNGARMVGATFNSVSAPNGTVSAYGVSGTVMTATSTLSVGGALTASTSITTPALTIGGVNAATRAYADGCSTTIKGSFSRSGASSDAPGSGSRTYPIDTVMHTAGDAVPYTYSAGVVTFTAAVMVRVTVTVGIFNHAPASSYTIRLMRGANIFAVIDAYTGYGGRGATKTMTLMVVNGDTLYLSVSGPGYSTVTPSLFKVDVLSVGVIDDIVTVGGALTTVGTTTVGGALTVGTVSTSSALTVHASTSTNTSLSLGGGAVVGGTVSVAGAVALAGALAVNGPVTLTGPLTLAGNDVATRAYVDAYVDAARADIMGNESLPAALDTIAEIETALQGNAGFGVLVTQRLDEANVRLNSLLAGTRALPSLSVTGALTTGNMLTVNTLSTGDSMSLGGGARIGGALSVAGALTLTPATIDALYTALFAAKKAANTFVLRAPLAASHGSGGGSSSAFTEVVTSATTPIFNSVGRTFRVHAYAKFTFKCRVTMSAASPASTAANMLTYGYFYSESHAANVPFDFEFSYSRVVTPGLAFQDVSWGWNINGAVNFSCAAGATCTVAIFDGY
jgi:hypothetical protein